MIDKVSREKYIKLSCNAYFIVRMCLFKICSKVVDFLDYHASVTLGGHLKTIFEIAVAICLVSKQFEISFDMLTKLIKVLSMSSSPQINQNAYS